MPESKIPINFSFIIPHKNTPDLLQKCIDSIPHREDVQIIVVDDNSDSEKVDFEHFPGLNDSTVEVYLTKEGRGAGYARNVGLSHAVGKWVVFADADDYFLPCIEHLLNESCGLNYDVIFFKSESIILPSGEKSFRGEASNQGVDKAISMGDFFTAMSCSCPCKKIIYRDFLVAFNILFSECMWANDVVFSAKIAKNASSVFAFDIVAYCITESETSLIKTHTIASQTVRLEQECEAIEILKSKFPKIDYSESLFQNWFDLYKISKVAAANHIFKPILVGGVPFVKKIIQTLKLKYDY